MRSFALLLVISSFICGCTAPDGELLITKPGCGLIGCGGVGYYEQPRPRQIIQPTILQDHYDREMRRNMVNEDRDRFLCSRGFDLNCY